jgi:hypothetical protein
MDNKPMLQPLHVHDLMASNDNAYVCFEPLHEQMQKVIMRPLKFEAESRSTPTSLMPFVQPKQNTIETTLPLKTPFVHTLTINFLEQLVRV